MPEPVTVAMAGWSEKGFRTTVFTKGGINSDCVFSIFFSVHSTTVVFLVLFVSVATMGRSAKLGVGAVVSFKIEAVNRRLGLKDGPGRIEKVREWLENCGVEHLQRSSVKWRGRVIGRRKGAPNSRNQTTWFFKVNPEMSRPEGKISGSERFDANFVLEVPDGKCKMLCAAPIDEQTWFVKKPKKRKAPAATASDSANLVYDANGNVVVLARGVLASSSGSGSQSSLGGQPSSSSQASPAALSSSSPLTTPAAQLSSSSKTSQPSTSSKAPRRPKPHVVQSPTSPLLPPNTLWRAVMRRMKKRTQKQTPRLVGIREQEMETCLT